MIDNRLEKIKNISISDLWDKKTFRIVDELADQYYREFYIGEARELWQILTNLITDIEVSDKELNLLKKYQVIVDKLAWVTLPLLLDSDIEKLVKTKLLDGIKLEVNLVAKIEGLLDLAYGSFTLQEQRRLMVLRALKANKERIGNQPLKIEDEEEELPPTVGHWLKDYDQSSRIEQRKERLSLLEYLNTNKNVRQLSKKQKAALRQILKLYDFLRFLNQDLSVEETGHRLPKAPMALPPVVEKEITVKKQSTPSPPAVEEEVIIAYQGDLRQQEAINKETEKLNKKIGNDTVKLRVEFYQAVQTKNINKTIATLRLLVQQQDLEKFIQEDEKLNKFLVATWEKQYGKELVEEFKKKSIDLKFIRLFLQYVLEQRLGMSNSDAARVGMQIGNTFVSLGKKEYNKMAYFDVKTKTFKWFE